jgi:hypothetical protein
MDAFKIQNVEIVGASESLKEDVLGLVNAEMEGYIGKIFPRKNIFLFRKERMEEKVLEQYLKVKTIHIKRVGLSKIHVAIEERKPYALWCSSDAAETGECYFADVTGYIFTPAPYFSDHTYFELYGEPLSVASSTAAASSTSVVATPPDDSLLGKQYLPENIFFEAMLFVQMLDQNGMKTYSLTTRDMDLFELKLARGGVIRFTPKENMQTAVNDLKVAYEKKFSEQAEKTPEMLEYVDVRFADKVVFKFVDKSEE